jgi:hypothetical protein
MIWATVNPFDTATVATRRGRKHRVQKMFFQEVCFCGASDQVEPQQSWDQDIKKGLIQCHARDCEIKWVRYKLPEYLP